MDDTKAAPGEWEKAAANKRDELKAKIEAQGTSWVLSGDEKYKAKEQKNITGEYIQKFLTDSEVNITEQDVSKLTGKIKDEQLSSEAVVKAFCKRAAIAHQMTNCFLEIRFAEAIERAKELDEYLKTHGKLFGELHGIPVTLKDQFHIKGLDTSMAYAGWIGTVGGILRDDEKMTESELIRELHELGAIPIGKTSLVQSIWAPETNNKIFGYLRNPWNEKLSSGGSSGGEGVAQALRASAFGIGTDIGGSVSMPASYNAIYSLKPSAGRISFKNTANSGPGQVAIPTVAGIMGPSIGTLQLVFKSLLSTEPWDRDPDVLPIPYRENEAFQKLLSEPGKVCFGIMKDDGHVRPHPPVQRALDRVEKALRLKGYKLLIPWEGPSLKDSIDIHSRIARGDGCPDVFEVIKNSGEGLVREIEHLFPDGKPCESLSLVEYHKEVVEMKKYRNQYHEYWQATKNLTCTGRPVDAVILPVSPYAGVLPRQFKYSPYTSFANVLDYTSVVIPVTFASKELDKKDVDYKPLSSEDKENMDAYDAEMYDGGPAAVQILGQRLSEEKLLLMAQKVVDALKALDALDAPRKSETGSA